MKSTRKWLRLTLILLSLCMVTGILAACAQDPNDPNKGSSTTAATTEGEVRPNIPTDLNYARTFHILGWTNRQNRTLPPEEATDDVSRAVVERNQSIQDWLNVEFEWEFLPCQYADERAAYEQRVVTDSNNDKVIDLTIAYNLTPYRLSYKGYLTNLANTKYIDLTMPYWPQEYLENMMYRDNIFALVDNASVGTLMNLSCIFFNNTLLEKKNIASPYDLVSENNWTIATLRELIKDTYEDTNNATQGKDVGDTFGLCTSTAARLTCWYFAIGTRLSELDNDGNMVLTGSKVDEIDAALKTISDLFSTNDGMCTDSKQYVMFKDQRACFYLSVFHMAESINADELNINYGVAPNPKLNSEQTRYYTHIPNTHDAWSIPKTAKDQECSSAVLELFAFESYDKVTYVYYEKNLKLRYAPDERLAAMYDLVRESIVFDYVYVHKDSSLGADFDNAMRSVIQNPKQNWVDKWSSIGGSQETKFGELMAAYDSVIDGQS